jgi:hypothetical protein
MRIPLNFRLMLGVWLMLGAARVPAAVTFSITPGTVSNTYNGPITLQVAGLSAGGTVVVQKFLDLNTNGVIDGREWLVQQFSLTDGQPGMVIGGVTNFNVPGDTDGATNGQITAKLNYQSGDVMQTMVGKFLFKLSGGFSPPITNAFTVTNFPFAQNISGNVVSNGTSTTLSNAVVLLFPALSPGSLQPNGNPLAGTVANNAGAYSVAVPTGSYSLVAFRSNFMANFATATTLTLTSGQNVTTNLTLTNATSSVSGKMVDAANSSITLGGVLVPVQNTNGLMGVGFTATNGTFTVGVRPGSWGVGGDDVSLVIHGYLGVQNKTVASAGASGLTLSMPKATALIYGTVTDNLGNPLPGIDVYADDGPGLGLYQTDGYTDANGNYVVGIVGGSSDSWWIQVSTDPGVSANYVFSQSQLPNNGGLAAGTAVQQNFTAIPAGNFIAGNVKFKGTNVVGAGVNATALINGINYNQSVDTDAHGNFTLNVANGGWSVGVNCNGGSDSLDNILGAGTYACPNSINVNISGNNSTNNFAVQSCGGISIVTPSPLPAGEVNVYYDQFIQASSCGSSFNWSQTGGSLPANLNLYPGGNEFELAGTPSSGGTYTFTVQVNDGTHTTNQQFSVSISNALQIVTASLPDGTNGAAYGQTLQAAGGLPFGGASPYGWTVVSGALPGNLNLSTNGLLAGTPSAAGAFNFTVEAADALGAVYDQGLSLNIVSTNIVTPPPLSVGTAGGQIIVLWPAAAGTNFTLEMTTNVSTGPWVPATGGTPAVSFLFTNAGPMMFYRLH